MKHQNLANLPKEEMDKIAFERQLSFDGSQRRVIAPIEFKVFFKRFLETIDQNSAKHIRDAMNSKRLSE